jgi:hypothetical protein
MGNNPFALPRVLAGVPTVRNGDVEFLGFAAGEFTCTIGVGACLLLKLLKQNPSSRQDQCPLRILVSLIANLLPPWDVPHLYTKQ